MKRILLQLRAFLRRCSACLHTFFCSRPKLSPAENAGAKVGPSALRGVAPLLIPHSHRRRMVDLRDYIRACHPNSYFAIYGE